MSRPPIVRLFPLATLAVILTSFILSLTNAESKDGSQGERSDPSPLVITRVAKAPNSGAPDSDAPAATNAVTTKTAQHDAEVLQQFAGEFCLDCHTGDDAESHMELDVLLASEADQAQLDTWAKIVTALKSGHMPPGEEEQPTEQQRLAAIHTIEQQQTDLLCSGDPDPGRVTIRRLSRDEYHRTIRDLVGVDFNAAEDFPTDDIGYGFDNNGDVLSMPTILLEKYLRAAEKILDQAIVTQTTIEPELYHYPVDQLQRSPEMEADAGWITQEGEIYVEFEAPHAGEYTLRAWAAGQQAGPEHVRMGLKLGETTLREFEVKTNRHHSQKHEVTATLQAGKHRIAAEFLNDYWNPDAEKRRDRDRNLTIRSMEIHGPTDGPAAKLPETHRQIFVATPDATTSPQRAASQILERFASRAFRRPATPNEVQRLLKLFSEAQDNGDSFEASIEIALSAVLVSPHFLFRVELDHEPTEPGGAYRIGEYELASRLSYFLWSTMPDAELTQLAAAGRLSDPKILDAQVMRMLKSPKSQALVDNFAAQWLQLRRLDEVQPDKTQFPFDEELRRAMRNEVAGLFETVMRKDRNLFELLDADYTFLNERLAKHYGIDGVTGSDMRRVSLTDRRRGGILTTAAVLTVTSNPTRTSPVKRGKWILEQLLGITNESPPNVPEFEEQPAAAEAGLSLRERLNRHTADPSCASCHMRLDPMGFSLENYDAVGRWRERDGDLPVDAEATMPDGTEFSGASGLRKVLAKHRDEYVRCLSRAMLTFALGRGLEHYDACAVQGIAETVAAEEYRFSAMVRGIVQSYPFQFRRILRKEEVENE